MGWYIATIPFAWAYLACASYGYFQRKYRIIADMLRLSDSAISIALAAGGSLFWPIMIPAFYFVLCERNQYGFAIPFTDPFKKERQNGHRQAAQARQSGSAHPTPSGAGGTGANQNSGGAGKGTGQGGLTNMQGGLTNVQAQLLAQIQQQRAYSQALNQALQQQHAHGLMQAQAVTSFPQGGGGAMQGANAYNNAIYYSSQQLPESWTRVQDPLPTTTVFGELIGWRSWKVLKGAVLTSCVVADVWLPGVPMEGPILDEHQSGGAGEGIHAYKQEPHKSVYAEQQDGYVYATGSVWLYGDVVEHEHGYRADHAMVRSIDAVTSGDQALLTKLRERYTPTSKEFKL